MLQTKIFLTETFLDQQKLNAVISSYLLSEINLQELSIAKVLEVYPHHKNQSRVFVLDATKKSDLLEEINEFYQTFSQQTVLIIGQLEDMAIQTQEGLLKFLEEPPVNLIPVITSQSISEIIPTISSRAELIKIPTKLVMQMLDESLLEKTKKLLPPPKEVIKELLKKSFVLPDLSKVERVEMAFWLWQLEMYLTQMYLQDPQNLVADTIENVVSAIKLNNNNLQKKFVVAKLMDY